MLMLKNTFEFIHNVLKSQTRSFEIVGGCTHSQDDEDVLEAYQYYQIGEGADIHCGTLILLRDKIEFHQIDDNKVTYHTLTTFRF